MFCGGKDLRCGMGEHPYHMWHECSSIPHRRSFDARCSISSCMLSDSPVVAMSEPSSRMVSVSILKCLDWEMFWHVLRSACSPSP